MATNGINRSIIMPLNYDDILDSLQSSTPNTAQNPTTVTNQPIAQTTPSSSSNSYDNIINMLSPSSDSASKNPVIAAMDLAHQQEISRQIAGAEGFKQGARNVMASAQNIMGGTTLGGLLPTPEENVAALAQYNKDYSSNPAAGFGKFGGETAATIPFIEAGGALVEPVVASLSEAPAIGGAARFLSGRLGQTTDAAGNLILDNSGNAVQNGNKFFNFLSAGADKSISGALKGGGAAALTSSESPQSVWDQVKAGGATGAALNLIVPGLASVARAGMTPFESDTTYNANKLLLNLARDQITPEEAATKLQTMGPNATLADVGGANVRGLTGAIAHKPGLAQNEITTFLNNRQNEQQSRILNAATTGLDTGPDFNYQGSIDDLIKQRSQTSSPAYKKAFSANPIANEDLDPFWTHPTMQSGIRKGLEMQSLEAVANKTPYNPISNAISGWKGDYETGQPVFSEAPNVQLLDAGKKGLDSIIQTHTDPITGKMDSYGATVNNFRKSFLSEVDKAYPDYAQARASFSGPSESINSINAGNNFMRNGAAGNVKELADMSDNDKSFFRIGVANALSDMLNNTPETANAANKILNTKAKQNALKAVFPSEDAYNDFADTVNNENTFYKTKNLILGGSPTAPRLAAMQDAAEEAPISISDIYHAAQGNLGRSALNVLGKAKNSFSSLTPERTNALQNILVNPDQQSVIDQLNSLNAPQPQNSLTKYLNTLGVPATTIGLMHPPYQRNQVQH